MSCVVLVLNLYSKGYLSLTSLHREKGEGRTEPQSALGYSVITGIAARHSRQEHVTILAGILDVPQPG